MINDMLRNMGQFEITVALDNTFEETICTKCPLPHQVDDNANKCRYCAIVNMVQLFGIDKYDMEQMLDSLERRIGGGR